MLPAPATPMAQQFPVNGEQFAGNAEIARQNRGNYTISKKSPENPSISFKRVIAFGGYASATCFRHPAGRLMEVRYAQSLGSSPQPWRWPP